MTGFTRKRVAALAVVGVALLGLAWVGLGRGDDPVSVPKGALAGDLLLHPCTYDTEDGGYAADCGTLVVPENRHDSASRLIAIPVTRIRALSPSPKEPVFRLQGGPGLTNMTFSQASRFAENRDVVLVGYRGIDGSVRLDCPEVESALKHSTDYLSEKSFAAYGAAFRSCAARLTADGVDLDGYGLVRQADDIEAARTALGYDRIDLLSESAGTRLAMIYAWRHPGAVHRSVMYGANPPGGYLWDPKTTNEQIRRYAELCSADESCSGRTDDLAATFRRTEIPDHWFFLPVKEANVKLASFFGLMETTPEAAPLTGPMTIDSWLAAADGDASAFWFQTLASDLLFPGAFVWGEYASVGRIDDQAAREYFASQPERYANLGYAGSAFTWGGGRLVDAWPAGPDEDEYSRVRSSEVDTLLVGGEVDFAIPPQIAAKELLPYLPNGHQVVLPGYGHSTSFWEEQPEAGTRLINTFLDTGKVDDSGYVPAKVDFSPEITQPALGKGFAGGMVGLALLTVLSLLWMALRAWRRPYGRKSSVVLRSVYPVVLGLGGWLAGVLLVITTLPGTPLDDDRLATLSVGIPVGLGVYFAWVSRGSKVVGLLTAMAGGLAGAWLGFQAGSDLLALVTAIVGATAGSNLALLFLDARRDRRAPEPTAETERTAPLEVSPSAG
jgi:pimeloyl-ACP methyl ester carboxylesterase